MDASEAVKQLLIKNKKKKSGLGPNQADASMAIRSLDPNSIVLTNENKTQINKQSGLLQMTAKQGGRIVFLRDEVEPSGLSLGDYLRTMLRRFPTGTIN